MKTWTIEEMLAEKPCPEYTPEIITKLWAARKRLLLVEILALDIPATDRMWAVWRPGALSREQETALLDKIVTRAIANHALHCKIAVVEQWARKWLSGEDRSEAAAWAATEAAWAATEATWAAARAAAWAARAAAEAAAREARAAAEAAAREAAWAAWAAARAAARAARAAEATWEHDLQVLDVLSVIDEENSRGVS